MNNQNTDQYNLMELRKEDLDPDPFRQFNLWYRRLPDTGIKYPDAVNLATVSKEGIPSSRIVLLKGVDNDGFVFYTNSNSRKGKDINDNPVASLCFWWEVLERQVRISGSVQKLPDSVADEYFATRPRGSQIGAWASSQSKIIRNRKKLDDIYLSYTQIYDGKNIPRPEYWNGYKIIPFEMEFWQGRPNRMHDRLRYRYDEQRKWVIERLQP